MSEDSSFKKDQKNKEERVVAPDFFGSLGKGTLEKEKIEALGNAFGLTPLRLGVNHNNRTMDRENNEIIRTEMNSGSVSSYGVRTSSLLNYSDKYTENTEILKNTSGLTPFCPSGEIYSLKKKSLSMVEDFSANKGLETVGNSSGLTQLNYDTEPPMGASKRKDSPQRTLRTQSEGLTNFDNKGE